MLVVRQHIKWLYLREITPEEAIEMGYLPGMSGGLSGGMSHYQQDADTYASWGVDYLKYDWCSYNNDVDYQITLFSNMRNALLNTGRKIVYSINPYSIISAPVSDEYPNATPGYLMLKQIGEVSRICGE